MAEHVAPSRSQVSMLRGTVLASVSRAEFLDVEFERTSHEMKHSVPDHEEDEGEVQVKRCCKGCFRPVRRPGARFCVDFFFICTCCCFRGQPRPVSRGGFMLGLLILTLLGGALFYWGVEGVAECEQAGLPFPQGVSKWTFGSSLYFMIIFLTTIGYGDYYPTLTGTKVFTILYGLFGLVVMATTLGYFAAVFAEFLERSDREVVPRLRRCGIPERIATVYCRYRVTVWISATYIVLLVTGACLFGWAEPFDEPRFLNGLYFTFITLATVGFGDLLPTHAGTRLWALLFAFVGVALFGFMVGAAGAAFSKKVVSERKREKPGEAFRAILDKIDSLKDDAKDLAPKEKELVDKYLLQFNIEA